MKDQDSYNGKIYFFFLKFKEKLKNKKRSFIFIISINKKKKKILRKIKIYWEAQVKNRTSSSLDINAWGQIYRDRWSECEAGVLIY